MFVLMLASQADEPDHPETQVAYDRIPREPASAVGVAFLLLCLITGTVIGGRSSLPVTEGTISKWQVLEKLSKKLESNIIELDPTFVFPVIESDGNSIQFSEEGTFVVSSDSEKLYLDESILPTNTQMVGWSLVNDFPISLELAGVILLMAMFGAAILARRAIDLTEQRKNLLLDNDESGGQS